MDGWGLHISWLQRRSFWLYLYCGMIVVKRGYTGDVILSQSSKVRKGTLGESNKIKKIQGVRQRYSKRAKPLMLLMHWDRHAPRAAQGSGVKEGFHLFYLSPLFRLHRAHPLDPSTLHPLFLCFSEAQILIVPTVIYQSRTLFFSRQGVCVFFVPTP